MSNEKQKVWQFAIFLIEDGKLGEELATVAFSEKQLQLEKLEIFRKTLRKFKGWKDRFILE